MNNDKYKGMIFPDDDDVRPLELTELTELIEESRGYTSADERGVIDGYIFE